MAENSKVRAPYNFVPFSNKVLWRYGSAEELPRHDRLDSTLKSGEIHVTMTADTPETPAPTTTISWSWVAANSTICSGAIMKLGTPTPSPAAASAAGAPSDLGAQAARPATAVAPPMMAAPFRKALRSIPAAAMVGFIGLVIARSPYLFDVPPVRGKD